MNIFGGLLPDFIQPRAIALRIGDQNLSVLVLLPMVEDRLAVLFMFANPLPLLQDVQQGTVAMENNHV